MNRADFERDANQDGYTISEGVISPDKPREPHIHEFDARLYVLSGTLIMRCGDQAESFNPGGVCTLKGGTEHVEQCGPDGAVFLAAKRYPQASAA